MSDAESQQPVIVGVAQYCDRDSPPDAALSPLDMLVRVAERASADARGGPALLGAADAVCVVRTFFDSSGAYAQSGVAYTNLPKSLANRIGAKPGRLIYPHVGGNTPQMLVNEMAEEIARGGVEVVLLAGAEAMRTAALARKQGVEIDWRDDPGGAPEEIGDPRPGVVKHELVHGIGLPVNTYPLFENALGHHYGRTPVAHRLALGELFAPFSRVAAANPYAAFPTARSAEELATPTAENRYIGYPYTKHMNAQMYVDQAAAVILTSVGAARKFGIPEDRWVFLHGCADISEKWLISERVDYHSAPAISVGARHAFDMAGKTSDDIAYFDLYSCFPSAVEVACDALGIAHDDPRGLTVTGGLPFFGGPGNNYTMHAIAEMAARLRAQPGSYGFVSGNGWYLTKHSLGIYSTARPGRPFERVAPARYQHEIDALDSPPFTETPSGDGEIETFTVIHDKAGAPAFAIIIGRQADRGARFLAQMSDPSMLAQMIDKKVIGRRITVESGEGGPNQAAFAGT